MWRNITAGNFGFLLLIFLLPWIDVRCKDKQGGASFSLFTQSGFQATYGDFSVGELLNDGKGQGPQQGGFQKKNDLEAAPIMIVYALAVVGGLVVALAVPRGRGWMLATGGCAAAAILALGLQTVVGFPLQGGVEKDMADKKKAPAIPAPVNVGPFGPNMNMNMNGNEPEIYATYAFGFYFACLGTLALPFGIAMAMKEQLPKPRRRSEDDDEVETQQDNPSL